MRDIFNLMFTKLLLNHRQNAIFKSNYLTIHHSFLLKFQKKALTEQEHKLLEEKMRRREKRKIQKEMKERQLKRLWEAQSIQRKLNEVDVKMFELEERAKGVERNLRDENGKTIVVLSSSFFYFENVLLGSTLSQQFLLIGSYWLFNVT